MGQITGKRALITGGASGIGRAIARLFSSEGAAVAIVDSDRTGGEGAAAELQGAGCRSLFLAGDVSCDGDCDRAVSGTVEAFGGLDLLVNNAGIIRRASVTELSTEDWDRTMAVNLSSVFFMSRRAIPELLKAGGGAIVNIASGWGLVGGARAAAYCASKGGVVQLTRAMAIDHGPDGIRVNCVCPGDTETGMLLEEARQLGVPADEFHAAAARRPLGRTGTPDDIARAVLFLSSDASGWVTGTTLVVDGGGLAG